jgi:orotidine-5'-phosphate decarboxylase
VLAVVTKLAKQSVDAGAQAIVSSPLEVSAIRAAVGSDVTLITPGVRFEKSDSTDQKRVLTPEEAIKAGSDLLVVGRPITAKGDVGKNAQEIAHKVNQIL